jgi:hypothetical protein
LSDTSISVNARAARHDTLPTLVQLLYVFAPLQIVMVYAGTTELTAGIALGATIGGIGALLLASSRLSLRWSEDRPTAYMLLFLCFATLSTSQTIYGPPAIQKGAINLSAMLVMVLMAVVVKQTFVRSPHLFLHVIRITAVMTGIAGLTVVLQSFVANVLRQPDLVDLSFTNDIWGVEWYRFAPEDTIVRAQGIFGEPSSLAVYLGIAVGLAIVRLGLVGSKWSSQLRTVVPAWAAASVLVSIVLSFSSVAYVALFAGYLGALATRMRFGIRSIVVLLIGATAAAAILALAALQAGDAIRSRVVDLMVLSQLGGANDTSTVDRETNLSVQVLFLNAYVTLQNLTADPWLGAGVGAHPFAYEALVPELPLSAKTAIGLNAMDANSLFLRLLSETGVLGTSLFTVAVLAAWYRTRKVVLAKDGNANLLLKAIAIGVNGGLTGVFVAKMARSPTYYEAEFWALFGLCIAIPAVASMVNAVDLKRSRVVRALIDIKATSPKPRLP